jgi:polyferredoxin
MAKRRVWIQAAFAALFDGYAAGFAKGKIFTGPTKGVCVPVLNCYSCPGALGACPIGSLQAVAGGKGRSISFYILGVLMLFGLVFGRLLCGFACPFGFVQDLLAKIPVRKRTVPERIDRPARKLKYVLLACVLVLPAAVSAAKGAAASPYFCKYLCPAGTLEGGLPLLLANPNLRALAGALFSWKAFVLAVVAAGAVFIPRFFCRYLCPLGAFYSLFNRFALYRMEWDASSCTGCGTCEQVCPMAVRVTQELACSGECIRCGKCKAVCPAGAISSRFDVPARKPAEEAKE